MSTIYNLPTEHVAKLIAEIPTKGSYPLLETAERWVPSDISDKPTTARFDQFDGGSFEATEDGGGLEITAQSFTTEIPYLLYRGYHKLGGVISSKQTLSDFLKANGGDQVMELINNQIEAQGIIAIQAAKDAGSIANETAHVVGGANTTFDAMTDAQLIAYLNHVFATIRATRYPVPNKAFMDRQYLKRFINIITGAQVSVGSTSVTVSTNVSIDPDVKRLIETGLYASDALTASGYVGARTKANPIGKDFVMFADGKNASMLFTPFNQKIGEETIAGTLTTRAIYEYCAALTPVRLNSMYYVTKAFA